MWTYNKTLQYPINIKCPDPRLAKVIISQYGGPDGELAASLRYLSQRFGMPDQNAKAILNDIGTEELAHLEMVGTIVHQLTKGASIEEIEKNKYKIVNLGYNSSNKLSITEQIVYQELFKDGSKENIISENYSFISVFPKVNACLEQVMDKRINDIKSRNKMYLTFALLFIGIITWVVSYLYIKDLNPTYNIVYVLSFISIFISGFFAIITSRKTSYGEMISSKVLGFRNYLNTAEKNQLNKLVEDDPNYFYNILPYTYVLNISKKWIDTFEKKNMPNIDLSALECYENSLFMIMSE